MDYFFSSKYAEGLQWSIIFSENAAKGLQWTIFFQQMH
ncbi:hypothetical protein SGRA_4035 [Saprospira grandis str. Lewin]|uniref:Uncharacterized protein n=1 Tax=Saprospira grandis (strain Lewin) TaxID=984262 RepID=H6L8M5_SAPGL|nr:hypothetical protein SGRA_4035 [Saprospira grandis str. Lewin]